ncbi:DUF7033 domain-containing protein [Psychroflexus sp. ALD_RP9]|uniref:DUF7033 domain-containing protein n=1 Tax=Psychroflexus sp. ALD_RP9 TaxID=2777186 RepID=UPI001A8F53B2|nr:carbohydrate esterase [Psychroflexus sp. ALD_RP9]QSS97764.1 carbohydrate esterase [Psychroflexus sp. ALD_RP9]
MEILVYVPQNTSRLHYIFDQICGELLGFKVKFTSKVENFIAFQGVKFSYAKNRLGNEVFIQQFGLLEEQGISDVSIIVETWEDLDVPCFFRVSNDSDLPFDIFSASFYLLSRYEEYQPHVKNEFSCYPFEESLAYQKQFLHLPVVEIWAAQFKAILSKKFNLQATTSKYSLQLNIAIAEAFAYNHRGFVRLVGASFRDIFNLKFKSIYYRIKSILRLSKDPYDVYDELILFSRKHHISTHFFFQLSNYTRNSKSISHHKRIYHKLIKSMGDYSQLGILPGYEAIHDIKILGKEKKRWQAIVNRNLNSSLIKNYGINFPTTFEYLNKLEIQRDFSMGYPNQLGYRAGTATPFYFYDLSLEQVSKLKLIPYVMNSKLLEKANFSGLEAQLMRLKLVLKKHRLPLYLVVSNADFSQNYLKNKLFKLFDKLS